MQKIPLTKQGHTDLEAELKDLKHRQRPAVIAAISEAREHGDLSENAEYHAAREQQSFIEGRIEQVEAILSLAEIIDPAKISGDTVKFAATVKVVDCDTDDEHIYQIVGDEESDIETGKLAISSPVARALIGKKVEDSVEVRTPKGTREYEILEILYK
ncbi:MAG: transcription elongation factor GreA [Micavibrio sp.]|nr:transcription elongation factor GreA [Micavibrio sp.]|tara:strand:+ start:231 stop:704 length:474 start_codon:yes stop_codon:yes gene_type:complete